MNQPAINLKKVFLYLLIGSITLSAVLGIAAIIFGNFGEFEMKIIGTTLTITLTSMLGLACGACYETKRARILPLAGIVFSILSAVLWIATLWAGSVYNDTTAKIILTVSILAGASSLLSLLTIARLDRRFYWSRVLAHITVWAFSAIVIVLAWSNFENQTDLTSRVLGVLAIVIAAVTIVTPVFHRLSTHEPEIAALDAEIEKLRARLAELEKQRAELNTDEN